MARVLLLCGYLSVQIVLCLSYGYSTTYPMDYRQSNRGSSTDMDKLVIIYAKLVTRMKDYTELQRMPLNEGITMCRNKLKEGMKTSSSSHKDLIYGVKLCVVKEILQFLHLSNADLGVSADELQFLKLDYTLIEPFDDKYPIDVTTEDTTEEYIHTTISPMSTIGNSVNTDTEISFKNAGWSQKTEADCWSKCGSKDGSCPGFCGQGGYCCRKGFRGCPDGAAEASPNFHTCVIKTGCKSTEFACADGLQCIRGSYRCDGGPPDCRDGSDEAHCRGCNSTEFACADGLQCIRGSYRCDGGPPDCSDGSDEAHCRGCNSTEFACADGLQCIRGSYRCDGGPPDCSDGSDEAHCREQEDLSLGQYFLEAVNWMKKKDTHWRYFLPEDTDIDQDGNLSDLEIQHKFNTYMGEVFKLLDQDKDNSITEEEFRSLKMDIPQLTKAVDIALENFPLRPFLLATEALVPNEDDVYDENDFLRPFFPDTETTTEGRSGLNQGLMDLLYWEHTRIIWDEAGRFLLIADANGDGKLTLEELATKGKELMTKILEFLDENQDGKISLEDINLHLTVGPIQSLVSGLFEYVTAGKGEIDLYNIEIAGQNMNKYFYRGVNPLTEFDNNRDGKLNAADTFYRSQNRHYRSPSEESFLLPMLSEKLDKNQDGKIQQEELRQFINEMFIQLDMDKDGALTLEDVYSLLRENGLNCLQVGALRSFTRVFLDKIDSVMRNFFSYIFHQFDMDGNGQISTTELEQMHVPCDSGGNPGYRDHGYRGPSSGYRRDYGYRGTTSGYRRDYGYRGPTPRYRRDYGNRRTTEERGTTSRYRRDYGNRHTTEERGTTSGYRRDYGNRRTSSGYRRDYGNRRTTSRYQRDYANRGTTSEYRTDYGDREKFLEYEAIHGETIPEYDRDYGDRETIPEYNWDYEAYGTDLSTPRPTDPYNKKTCFDMYQTYFGTKILDLIRSFPDFVFSERHGRGPSGYGGGRDEPMNPYEGGRNEPKKKTFLDKLTKHACEMLT